MTRDPPEELPASLRVKLAELEVENARLQLENTLALRVQERDARQPTRRLLRVLFPRRKR